MITLAQALELALAQQRAGNLPQAEQLCRQILEADPSYFGAWHLLGLLAAIAGKYGLAAEHLRQALRLRPDVPDAHNNLANVLTQLGHLDEALASYRQALLLNPRHAQANTNLGNLLRQQGKLEEALACYQQAVHSNPDFAGAHNNLGLGYRDLKKPQEALACFQRALALDPNFAEAHHNLGNVLVDLGRLADAVASYRHAVGLKPQVADIHNNLGIALREQGALEEAAVCLVEGLRLHPDHAEMHNQLGVVFWEQGRLADAVGHFDQTVRLDPHHVRAHFNRAVYWLLQGRLQEGWEEYEWRWKNQAFDPPHTDHPRWDGGPLNGRTILLYPEQGLGDTLMFVRYASLVKQRGGRVLVECHPDLLNLLAGCEGIDERFVLRTPPPSFDVQAPLLSLPRLCGTTPDTIPANIPYLKVDEARVARLRQRLALLPGYKVGICWQGSKTNTNDARRSVPLNQFAPLAEVAGVCLISLQRGPGSEQLPAWAGPGKILDFADASQPPSESWLDSAALVRALDLVISVDTAVIHLAGAQGVPVWTAVPFVPDWRWRQEREDTPWYPTMRLFRQRRMGDWDEVCLRMREALREVCQREPGQEP
jgi:Tfp pilus assembly protein PilF